MTHKSGRFAQGEDILFYAQRQSFGLDSMDSICNHCSEHSEKNTKERRAEGTRVGSQTHKGDKLAQEGNIICQAK